MKNALFTLICLLVAEIGFAQNLKKFRVGIGTGYAIASGYASGGIFGTLEPGYRIIDKVAMGLRLEIAGLARGGIDGMQLDVDVSRINSTTLNAIYYFDAVDVRPFAGIGAGRYRLGSIEYSVGTTGPSEARGQNSKFGWYPRVGIEAGHFVFSIDYNVIPKTRGGAASDFRNSYLAFRIGAFFGGGQKR